MRKSKSGRFCTKSTVARGLDVVREQNDLRGQIESLRAELHEMAGRLGLHGEEVLEKSKELDILLNVYHSAIHEENRGIACRDKERS